jgi:hypothetical protein
VAIIALLILRWLVNIFRDLCCCRYRKWMKARSKHRKSKGPRHHYTTDSDFDDGEQEELREVKASKKGKWKKDRGRRSSKDAVGTGGSKRNQHSSQQEQPSTPRGKPVASSRHNETQQEWIDDDDH